MASTRISSEDVVRLGEQIYNREIRRKVERKHHGKFLFVDVESGDYEIDEDQVSAALRLRQRHPDSLFYLLRIGYPVAVKFGPRLKMDR